MFRSLCRLAHQLPSLPYKMEALQPYMSVETLEYHYGKHHAGYVQKLNQLIEGKADLEKLSLEQLIQTQSGIIFNQASQIWNHNFFWKCMIPNGKGAPSEILRLEIEKSFGSLSKFKETFSTMAAGHFGSGWIWLVWKNNRLELLQGHDSYTPIQDQEQLGRPILTCDVWEHAYYIDYRNSRPNYLNNWWNLVNWEFAESNLKR